MTIKRQRGTLGSELEQNKNQNFSPLNFPTMKMFDYLIFIWEGVVPSENKEDAVKNMEKVKKMISQGLGIDEKKLHIKIVDERDVEE